MLHTSHQGRLAPIVPFASTSSPAPISRAERMSLRSEFSSPNDESLPRNLDAPSSTWDIFRARISGLDRFPSDSPPDDILHQLHLTIPQDPAFPVAFETPVSLTAETAFLLQTYLRTVATWMDLMDHGNTYQLLVPKLALTSQLIYHCVCAFTAQHLALSTTNEPTTTTSWSHAAHEYYGLALRHLITALSQPSHSQPLVLTATILLSSYEIIAGIASEHHRRHLIGQIMLIKRAGVNARSSDRLDRANFWIHVRHEIAFALTTGQPLVLGPADWGVDLGGHTETEVDEADLGNRVLYILARVICTINSADSLTSGQQDTQRAELLSQLARWHALLNPSCRGVPFGDIDSLGFRGVYFPVTAAAAASFWYHIANLLLYAEPLLQDETYADLVQYHAIKAGEIALGQSEDRFRVFATYGIYFAAKHINGIARKARLWGVLAAVEAELGYQTQSMIQKLQKAFEKQHGT